MRSNSALGFERKGKAGCQSKNGKRKRVAKTSPTQGIDRKGFSTLASEKRQRDRNDGGGESGDEKEGFGIEGIDEEATQRALKNLRGGQPLERECTS